MVEKDIEIEEEEQQEIREPQPEDKPKKKKVLSEKQLKVLADGREKARLRREEINREAYLKNKTKLLQEAKEIKKFQQKEQTKKVESDFEQAQKELFEGDEEKKGTDKPKKVKKKIIKYVSSSDSNSSDDEDNHEVVYKKKSSKRKQEPSRKELVEKSSTDILRDKLVNDQIDSLRELLKSC